MSSNYHLDNTEQAKNEEVQENNVYVSTTHWPSDQHKQLPMCSWHARTDQKLLSDESGMDVDAYSDNSYGYSRSMSTNYDETLTQHPTNYTTLVDSSTNDQLAHVNDQSTLISKSFTQAHDDDNYALPVSSPSVIKTSRISRRQPQARLRINNATKTLTTYIIQLHTGQLIVLPYHTQSRLNYRQSEKHLVNNSTNIKR
jgi:hypothetical protein